MAASTASHNAIASYDLFSSAAAASARARMTFMSHMLAHSDYEPKLFGSENLAKLSAIDIAGELP